MADQKLSALTTGGAIIATDLFYSAKDAGGGVFNQVKQPASALLTYIVARPQRSVTTTTGSAITVNSTDQILNINISAVSPTYALPAANTRAGVPITFKDVGGQFAAHPLTVNRSGSDTIEGLTSVTVSNNFAALTLTPGNDGVNTTLWYIT